MKQRNCPLCGCPSNQKIETIKMILPKKYSLPETYTVVSCSQCGFCYADTPATLEDYRCYYELCNTYSGTPVDVSEWNELHTQAGEMLEKHMDFSGCLMDMGFGQGNFLKWLQQKGYSNIMGIDPSPISVETIRKDGVKAVCGSVFEPAADEYKSKFDCVFLFDVLEHLLFPKAAMDNLKGYLKKSGFVMVSVPNYNCLKNNCHPITNMFNQEHINYFSAVSLDNLMQEHGFACMETNVGADAEKEEIIAMYQLSEMQGFSMQKDRHTQHEIEEYMKRFAVKRARIEQELEDLKRCGKENLYVWGTGAFTMWLLANTGLGEFDITFVDNNSVKVGQPFWKGIIHKPEDVVKPEMPILICSMLYAGQIRQQIVDMGLENDVVII